MYDAPANNKTALSKACVLFCLSERGIVGSNSSCMCVCLCIVSSGVAIGIATGCSVHRRLVKNLETKKRRRVPVTLTRMDAHDVTEYSNRQHNHVDTGNQSL